MARIVDLSVSVSSRPSTQLTHEVYDWSAKKIVISNTCKLSMFIHAYMATVDELDHMSPLHRRAWLTLRGYFRIIRVPRHSHLACTNLDVIKSSEYDANDDALLLTHNRIRISWIIFTHMCSLLSEEKIIQ